LAVIARRSRPVRVTATWPASSAPSATVAMVWSNAIMRGMMAGACDSREGLARHLGPERRGLPSLSAATSRRRNV
jgi:hypothetical protein